MGKNYDSPSLGGCIKEMMYRLYKMDRYQCECGSSVLRNHKARHLKTSKHLELMTRNDARKRRIQIVKIKLKQSRLIESIRQEIESDQPSIEKIKKLLDDAEV